jgi:hypothetical protein
VIPVSDRITMRPVWRRRQQRVYLNSRLAEPSEEEVEDAFRVLADPESKVFAPALWGEAMRILTERVSSD